MVTSERHSPGDREVFIVGEYVFSRDIARLSLGVAGFSVRGFFGGYVDWSFMKGFGGLLLEKILKD